MAAYDRSDNEYSTFPRDERMKPVQDPGSDYFKDPFYPADMGATHVPLEAIPSEPGFSRGGYEHKPNFVSVSEDEVKAAGAVDKSDYKDMMYGDPEDRTGAESFRDILRNDPEMNALAREWLYEQHDMVVEAGDVEAAISQLESLPTAEHYDRSGQLHLNQDDRLEGTAYDEFIDWLTADPNPDPYVIHKSWKDRDNDSRNDSRIEQNRANGHYADLEIPHRVNIQRRIGYGRKAQVKLEPQKLNPSLLSDLWKDEKTRVVYVRKGRGENNIYGDRIVFIRPGENGQADSASISVPALKQILDNSKRGNNFGSTYINRPMAPDSADDLWDKLQRMTVEGMPLRAGGFSVVNAPDKQKSRRNETIKSKQPVAEAERPLLPSDLELKFNIDNIARDKERAYVRSFIDAWTDKDNPPVKAYIHLDDSDEKLANFVLEDKNGKQTWLATPLFFRAIGSPDAHVVDQKYPTFQVFTNGGVRKYSALSTLGQVEDLLHHTSIQGVTHSNIEVDLPNYRLPQIKGLELETTGPNTDELKTLRDDWDLIDEVVIRGRVFNGEMEARMSDGRVIRLPNRAFIDNLQITGGSDEENSQLHHRLHRLPVQRFADYLRNVKPSESSPQKPHLEVKLESA
jgi:hypothetical protein